ncbi:hypothetical protein O1L60_34850 [Streptomyces diastatochromogenes]|nr:hypothetical protein [Streptomyces diastatochromogenes]
MAALGLLTAGTGAAVGVDYVVMRSNAHQVEEFLTSVAPRFPGLGQVSFGAVVPEGSPAGRVSRSTSCCPRSGYGSWAARSTGGGSRSSRLRASG